MYDNADISSIIVAKSDSNSIRFVSKNKGLKTIYGKISVTMALIGAYETP